MTIEELLGQAGSSVFTAIAVAGWIIIESAKPEGLVVPIGKGTAIRLRLEFLRLYSSQLDGVE